MLEWTFAADAPGEVLASDIAAAIRANQALVASNLMIEGDLDCSGAEFSHPLVIHNATFTGAVNFSDSVFAKVVDLTGCTFEQAVQCPRTRFGSRLILSSATMK